jgi:C-terminal processing protease CtpA/Prc
MIFRRVLLVAPLYVGLLSHAAAFDRRLAPPESLAGRWRLGIQMPHGYYRTPVEFTVKPDGRVELAVLGPLGSVSIRSGSGRISGGKLSMSAETSFGRLRVRARVAGDSLSGTWSPAGLFGRFFFKGEVRGERDTGSKATTSRTGIFDAVWEALDARFYDPRFGGVDWWAMRDRYRPRVEAARSDGELVATIRAMLAELRSSHLEFFALPGTDPVWVPKESAEVNAVAWRVIGAEVGYLKISRFDDDERWRAELDRAFAEFADLPSLIIDVRGNSGGSLGLALRVGDHVFTTQRPVGYFLTRRGLVRRGAMSIDEIASDSLPTYSAYDSAAFQAMLDREGGVMLETGGRIAEPYRGRIVVLIDEFCYSATEAFAGVVKETGAATLIGRRTAGAMLGADFVSLGDDWVLVLPVMDFRTAGGARLEGVGVEPDIAVKKGRGDPELKTALKLLRRR